MTATPAKYRPAPISQRDTLLARDGVDDCLVVSVTYLAASATLGELFVWPNGNQMGRRNRAALAKRARGALGPSFASGALNMPAAGPQMLKFLVPDAPALRTVGITMPTLREKLRGGWCAVLAGNPSHIKGASPLGRAGDVGHAIYLHREVNGRILVGDPYRPYSPRFGEWIPAEQVRQFAYRDDDKSLTACFIVQRGAWTQARLRNAALEQEAKHQAHIAERQRAMRKDIAEKLTLASIELETLRLALEQSQDGDPTYAKAAGWESALVTSIEALQELRTEGPRE